MRLSIKALLIRLRRATTIAAVVFAASGMLEIAGRPLFATIGKVAFNLAAVRFEAEELRQKATWALHKARFQSVA
jgi:hypothetical protein